MECCEKCGNYWISSFYPLEAPVYAPTCPANAYAFLEQRMVDVLSLLENRIALWTPGLDQINLLTAGTAWRHIHPLIHCHINFGADGSLSFFVLAT